MWDDIIEEIKEDGIADGSATVVRTVSGVKYTLSYGVAPVGSITSDDTSNWHDAAEEGVSTSEEADKSNDDAERKGDKNSRAFKAITGRHARKLSERIHGGKKPQKSGKKRDGKADTLDPLANGHKS